MANVLLNTESRDDGDAGGGRGGGHGCPALKEAVVRCCDTLGKNHCIYILMMPFMKNQRIENVLNTHSRRNHLHFT